MPRSLICKTLWEVTTPLLTPPLGVPHAGLGDPNLAWRWWSLTHLDGEVLLAQGHHHLDGR